MGTHRTNTVPAMQKSLLPPPFRPAFLCQNKFQCMRMDWKDFAFMWSMNSCTIIFGYVSYLLRPYILFAVLCAVIFTKDRKKTTTLVSVGP